MSLFPHNVSHKETAMLPWKNKRGLDRDHLNRVCVIDPNGAVTIFDVDFGFLRFSKHYREFVSVNGDVMFTLPGANAAIFERILEYCNHYKNHVVKSPLVKSNYKTNSTGRTHRQERFYHSRNQSQWQREFFGDDIEFQLEMSKAADFLDMPHLMYDSLRHLAELLRYDPDAAKLNITRTLDSDQVDSIVAKEWRLSYTPSLEQFKDDGDSRSDSGDEC